DQRPPVAEVELLGVAPRHAPLLLADQLVGAIAGELPQAGAHRFELRIAWAAVCRTHGGDSNVENLRVCAGSDQQQCRHDDEARSARVLHRAPSPAALATQMIIVPVFGSRRMVIPRPAIRSMPASFELRAARPAEATVIGFPGCCCVAGRNKSSAVAAIAISAAHMRVAPGAPPPRSAVSRGRAGACRAIAASTAGHTPDRSSWRVSLSSSAATDARSSVSSRMAPSQAEHVAACLAT